MNDLISRQAAIDALKEHRALYCDNTPDTFSKLSYAEKSRVDELDTAIATLVNLPSAQPERKTGRWIFCDTSCKCSICGEDPMTFVETTGFNSALMDREYPMRFCPNCGADMRGEQDG